MTKKLILMLTDIGGGILVAAAAVAMVQPSVAHDARNAISSVVSPITLTPDSLSAEAVDATAAPAGSQPSTTPEAYVPGALGSKEGSSSYSTTKWPHNDEDARWNSCDSIDIVINPQGAPAGALEDMKDAIRRTEAATGLDMKYLGQTNAKTQEAWGFKTRPGFEGHPPVLITWERQDHPGLAGSSAFAEGTPKVNSKGENVLVSGRIVLNIDEDQEWAPGFGSQQSRTGMYMHELGHIVGLDHVEDSNQLMHPNAGARDFGAGDLNGFKQLNSSTCLEVPPAE